MPSRNYWLFFLITLVIAAMHLTWAYNDLPERVASHFDLNGQPDGWSSRDGWAVTYIVLVAVMAAIFGGLVYLMPRLPDKSLNIPNRDYWLAPERRADTWRRLGEALLVMGGVTTLFDVGIMHMTVMANRSDGGQLGAFFWLLFGGYMAFVAVWAIWLVRKFRVPNS